MEESHHPSGRTVAEACRELRQHLGMGQEAFAREQGWALNTVSRYELGGRVPNGRALRRYLDLAAEQHRWDLVSVFGLRIYHAEGRKALPDFMGERLPRDFELVENLFVNILLRPKGNKLRRELMSLLKREYQLEAMGLPRKELK